MKHKLWRHIIIHLFITSTSLPKDPKLASVLGSRRSLKGDLGSVLVLRPVQDKCSKGVVFSTGPGDPELVLMGLAARAAENESWW